MLRCLISSLTSLMLTALPSQRYIYPPAVSDLAVLFSIPTSHYSLCNTLPLLSTDNPPQVYRSHPAAMRFFSVALPLMLGTMAIAAPMVAQQDQAQAKREHALVEARQLPSLDPTSIISTVTGASGQLVSGQAEHSRGVYISSALQVAPGSPTSRTSYIGPSLTLLCRPACSPRSPPTPPTSPA